MRRWRTDHWGSGHCSCWWSEHWTTSWRTYHWLSIRVCLKSWIITLCNLKLDHHTSLISFINIVTITIVGKFLSVCLDDSFCGFYKSWIIFGLWDHFMMRSYSSTKMRSHLSIFWLIFVLEIHYLLESFWTSSSMSIGDWNWSGLWNILLKISFDLKLAKTFRL